MPEQLSLLEILEVRTVLELYIVKKAAENITEQQIEELQASIDKMQKLMEEGDNGSVEESAFHRGLAEAAGNSALKSIYFLCEELFNSVQHYTWKGVQSVEGAPNTAVPDHQAILDALKEHNTNRAEILMRSHMEYAKMNIERLYANQE